MWSLHSSFALSTHSATWRKALSFSYWDATWMFNVNEGWPRICWVLWHANLPKCISFLNKNTNTQALLYLHGEYIVVFGLLNLTCLTLADGIYMGMIKADVIVLKIFLPCCSDLPLGEHAVSSHWSCSLDLKVNVKWTFSMGVSHLRKLKLHLTCRSFY